MLLASPGFHGVRPSRSQENASRFMLDVEWTDLRAHQMFKESSVIKVWRAAIGRCLVARAKVWHADLVVGG